jgi:hypothetical protein
MGIGVSIAIAALVCKTLFEERKGLIRQQLMASGTNRY